MRIVVLPLGEEPPYITELPEDDAYPMMRDLVGGYIEPVGCSFPMPDGRSVELLMWVNEEGKLEGLQRNLRASALAGQVIAGQAFLTGLIEGENETPVPEDVAQAIVSDPRTWQDLYSDTIKGIEALDRSGPYVIMCVGTPGIERAGQPDRVRHVIGHFLESYDPEYRNGAGHAAWTKDLDKAIHFDSKVEAALLYRTVPESRPTRPDGEENRPLTAYSINIVPVEEARQEIDRVRVLYWHLPEDGDHRRRSMRDMN